MTGKPSPRTMLEAFEAYKAKVLEWQKSRPPKFSPEPSAERLRLDYQKACNNYVAAFCMKQDVCFDGWIGDVVGEVACFADYIISLNNIIYDIDNRVPKGTIFDWHDYTVEWHFKNGEKPCMNYKSYVFFIRG